MRIWVFILSIYISGLALTPCQDSITCDQDTHLSDMDSHHDDCEGDLCSPFCSCTCCGVSAAFVFNFQYFFFKSNKPINSEWNIAYSSAFISSYYLSFWQPPKI